LLNVYQTKNCFGKNLGITMNLALHAWCTFPVRLAVFNIRKQNGFYAVYMQ
jgi:hypothetical protein